VSAEPGDGGAELSIGGKSASSSTKGLPPPKKKD
jgi:hypothetical protein